jgi:electron transport complex protein RnfA
MNHILISSIVLLNIVIIQTHGLYAILGVPLKMKSLVFVGVSLTILLFLSQLIMYPIKVLLLLDAVYLEMLIYVIVVISLYTAISLVLSRIHKKSSQGFLIHAPWIIIHTLIIGSVMLFRVDGVVFINHIMYTLGTVIGFIFILTLFIAIQFRIQTYKIPKAMQGLPIALMIAGLMALAILGFVGIV